MKFGHPGGGHDFFFLTTKNEGRGTNNVAVNHGVIFKFENQDGEGFAPKQPILSPSSTASAPPAPQPVFPYRNMAPPSLGRGPPGSESQPTGPPQLAPGRTSRLSVREHGDALRGTGASRLSASSRYPTLRSRRAGRYPPEPGGEDRSQRSEGCGLRGAEVEPALPAAHPPRLRRRQIPGRAAGGKTPTPEQESE